MPSPLHLDVGGLGTGAEFADGLAAAALLLVASGAPWILGLWSASRWRGSPALLAGFAAGAALFLLVDLVRQSALGAGTRSEWTALVLVAFAAGLLLPAWLPRRAGRAPGGAGWLAFAWALGVGAHGLGEGYVVGTEAHDVLLGVPFLAALSFLLHKGLEGACAAPLLSAAPSRGTYLATAAAVALPAAGGALLGAVLGPGRLAQMAFALGAGAAAWVTLELARRGTGAPRFYAAALAGAVAIFAAGLLHEI